MTKVPGEAREPSHAYLHHIGAQTEAKAAAAHPLSSAFTATDSAIADELADIVERLSPELWELAGDIHAHPELAFAEHHAIAALSQLLEKHHHTVEIGAYGLPTAGVAISRPTASTGRLRESDGTGAATAESDTSAALNPGRTVLICSEYDALEGIGHGCGHNLIAAAGAGAFLALAELRRRRPTSFPGEVRWLGTPAEEGKSGKEYLIRGGACAEVDAALMVHPYPWDTVEQVWLGRRLVRITFSGIAAHASAQPFMGRNALDAATLAYQGIGLLRQQLPPVDRIHAIISDGGQRASVIPERAQLTAYLRSQYPDTLRDLSVRIAEIARGAALMAGVEVEIDFDEHPPSLPVRTNRELAARFSQAMALRDRAMLPGGVLPAAIAASTDFGNVSYLVPAIHPLVKISPETCALHTEEFARAAISEQARTALADAVFALAITAYDFLSDDALAQAVADEFAAAGGEIAVADYFA